MLGYFTCPDDANEHNVRIEFGTTLEWTALIHAGTTNTGHLWLQAICSADADVDVTCSTMHLEPWTLKEQLMYQWPVFNPESVWVPCPDIPSFQLTAGTVYTLQPKDVILPYRRVRFRVTPKKAPDTFFNFAAFRMDLSVR